MSRSASNGYVQIRLSSKEVRMVHGSAVATIGSVANEAHKLRNWGKAGARRLKGIFQFFFRKHGYPIDRIQIYHSNLVRLEA